MGERKDGEEGNTQKNKMLDLCTNPPCCTANVLKNLFVNILIIDVLILVLNNFCIRINHLFISIAYFWSWTSVIWFIVQVCSLILDWMLDIVFEKLLLMCMFSNKSCISFFGSKLICFYSYVLILKEGEIKFWCIYQIAFLWHNINFIFCFPITNI